LDEQQRNKRNDRDQGRAKRIRTGHATNASQSLEWEDPLSPPRSQTKRSASKVTYLPSYPKGSKGAEEDKKQESDSQYLDINPRQLDEQNSSGEDEGEVSLQLLGMRVIFARMSITLRSSGNLGRLIDSSKD